MTEPEGVLYTVPAEDIVAIETDDQGHTIVTAHVPDDVWERLLNPPPPINAAIFENPAREGQA